MNCPSCGAPMTLNVDTYRCEYCKSVYVPGTDDEGITLLGDGSGNQSQDQCPICSVALVRAAIAHAPVLYCSTCHGISISMSTFPTLVETLRGQQHGNAAAPPVDPRDLSRRINCPHCHRSMEAHFYGGPGNVVIDSCEVCALNWLDHGELLRIARAPEFMEEAMGRDSEPFPEE
jgi:Zn-finger nucleic acid-binding protein